MAPTGANGPFSGCSCRERAAEGSDPAMRSAGGGRIGFAPMSTTKYRRIAGLLAAAALLLGACGSEDALEGEVVEDARGCTDTVERSTDAPEVAAVAEAPAEVETEDLTKGKGCEIEPGQHLSLDMVGATAADAKVFTDTWTSGRPISTQLGQGKLIPGLETGIEGMKVGGRRQITIPAAQAYGAEGNEAQGIGPDQALTFVVELTGLTRNLAYCQAATEIPAGTVEGKPDAVEMPVEAPTELVTKDLTEGTGEAATDGKQATVHYLGIGCSTGQQFDSSWDSGNTLQVTLGMGQVVPGFEQGIDGMKVGGRRQVEFPATLGYGPTGSPPAIGPNEPLVFVIELVELAEAPPESTTAPASTAPAEGGEGGDTTTAPAGGGEGETTTTAGQ